RESEREQRRARFAQRHTDVAGGGPEHEPVRQQVAREPGHEHHQELDRRLEGEDPGPKFYLVNPPRDRGEQGVQGSIDGVEEMAGPNAWRHERLQDTRGDRERQQHPDDEPDNPDRLHPSSQRGQLAGGPSPVRAVAMPLSVESKSYARCPCWLRSSPRSSSFSFTRSPMV